MEWWRSHPPHERVEITDKNSGEPLGTISNQDLRFLIDQFEAQGMEDNDFYFTTELLKMFDETARPGPELREFIRKALKGREDIEIHWHDVSPAMESGTSR